MKYQGCQPRERSASRSLLFAALAATLAVGRPDLAVAGAVAAPAANIDPVAVCRVTDEQAFRVAIEAVTIRSLESGLSSVDYDAAVDDEWRRLGLGAIIDAQVDIAVEQVKSETSWGSLIQSLGDEETAKQLTVAVAERVYRSEPVKKGIEDLATGIGKALGKRIEIATEDAARPAIQCLEAFLGPRYGSTVASVVTGTAGREFIVDPNKSRPDVGASDVLASSGDGLTGAAILIMRRQLANMAGRIGTRIAGSVLTRLVSVVAGGIGLVLIAKDVWDFRNGVMPIIAEEMKSEDTKSKVREELSKSLSEQIGSQVKELGASAAGRIVTVWREFQAQHLKVLELAERHVAYRAILDKVQPSHIARLGEATALLLGGEGEEGLMRRVADGSLEVAVNRLSEPAFDIARQTRSVAKALAWNGVAGNLIDGVVANEIFQRAEPSEFTQASLRKLLALEDPIAIGRLAGANRATREALLALDPMKAKVAALALSSEQLDVLSATFSSLPSEARDAVIGAIAERPDRLAALARPGARDAVLESKDRMAAIKIMLRRDGEVDGNVILEDLQLAWAREIDPRVIWERHPFVVAALGALGCLALLLLIRLLWPRRRMPANPATA